MKAFIKFLFILCILLLFTNCPHFFGNGNLQVEIISNEFQDEITRYVVTVNNPKGNEIGRQETTDGITTFTNLPADWMTIKVEAYSLDEPVKTISDMIDIDPFQTNSIQFVIDPGYLTGNFVSDYRWSPDGSKIAIVKAYKDKPYDNVLWVADKDLKNPKLLKASTVARIYDWQGDWILFSKDIEDGLPASYAPYCAGEVWRIKADGSAENQVTFTNTNGIKYKQNDSYNNLGTVSNAQFIPGTNLVYFLAHDGNGWSRSYTCNADGTDNWQHVSYPEYTWSIAVSPTGNKLIYAVSYDYNTPATLISRNIDHSEHAIIKGPLTGSNFIILSDGNRVVMSTGKIISMISIYGTEEQELINNGFNNIAACPGRNGNEILIYSSSSYDGMHVFLYNIAAKSFTQLTWDAGFDNNAALSPDGLHLAYMHYADEKYISGKLIIAQPNLLDCPPPPHAPDPRIITEIYNENFDSTAAGELPPGWIKNDYPAYYNYIDISTPIIPFTTNSLAIIDSQAGMSVAGQKTIDTQFTYGIIDMDFYVTEPGLNDFEGEFYFLLIDSSQTLITAIYFNGKKGVGWGTAIYDSKYWSGYLPFDSAHTHHLTLYMYAGDAKLFLDNQCISYSTYNPAAVSVFQFQSTIASIGGLYIDNLVFKGR